MQYKFDKIVVGLARMFARHVCSVNDGWRGDGVGDQSGPYRHFERFISCNLHSDQSLSKEERCFTEQIWGNVAVWEAHVDHISQGLTSVLDEYPFIN